VEKTRQRIVSMTVTEKERQKIDDFFQQNRLLKIGEFTKRAMMEAMDDYSSNATQ